MIEENSKQKELIIINGVTGVIGSPIFFSLC